MAPWQEERVPTGISTTATTGSSLAHEGVARQDLVTAKVPTPNTWCSHRKITGPATGAASPSQRVSSVTASDISQVRGARVTGQRAGSTQCVGQSQSAYET